VADPILLDEVVIPVRRARTRPRRRMDADRDPDTIGALPGAATDSGRSELDRDVDIDAEQLRDQTMDAARSAVPANPFGGMAQAQTQLPQAAQVLGDAQRAPVDDEAQTQARIDAAMSPLSPAQRTRVQGLPVVGDEDSAENAREIIGASQRAQGMPQPMPTQLRTQSIDLGGGSLRQASPYTPEPSMQLRAPAVASPRIPPPQARTPEVERLTQRALTELPPARQERAFRVMPPETDDRRGIIIDELDAQELADREGAPEEDVAEPDVIGTAPSPQLTPYEQRLRTAVPRRGVDIAEDQRDQLQAQRLTRAQRALAVMSAIPALFGGRSGGVSGAGIAQIANGLDPQAPLERIRARRAARDEAAAAAEQQAYERDQQERRFGIDERRIAQGEAATQQRAGYRDADILPDHPNAENERRLYVTSFGALPEHIRRTFPGFDPSNPDVQRAMSQMGAAQLRAMYDRLNEQVDARYPNARDWRSTARSGGRAHRGQLAGLGTPGRTIRRGDSGVTPEQLMAMDAAGVDEMPDTEQTSPAPLDRVRARRAAMRGPQGGGASGPARPAPQGRPILDRDVTDEEYDQLDAGSRTTVQATRAYMRQHPGTPWNVASANVNGMTDAHRSDLISQWGNPRVNPVPGFRLVEDTGRLTPQRMGDIREYSRTASIATALSREILTLVDRINALDLAENELNGNVMVQEALGKARRLQTLLRIVDRTGVPTGDEQQRAMQEAPEPVTPMQLLRSRAAYEAMPRSILSVTYRNMRSEGFLPERPRQGGR
jgi:hypothetical protein